MNMPIYRVAAIIPTRNRCQLLEECIRSLLASNIACDIIVIDNHSSDNTVEIVQSYLDTTKGKIIYLDTGGDTGSAGAINLGMKKAFECGYDLFWIMDDDTKVFPDTLEKLLDYYGRNSNIGFLSSIAVWKDGEPCVMNYHTPAPDWQKSKLELKYNALKVSAATFVSFLTTRQVVEAVGYPIKEYYIWGDDTEYSMRIAKKYPSYLIGESTVVHQMEENVSTGNLANLNDENRIRRLVFSVRNDMCTYRMMGVRKFLKFLFLCFIMFIQSLSKGSKHKFLKLLMIIKGLMKGIFFNPSIEYPDKL